MANDSSNDSIHRGKDRLDSWKRIAVYLNRGVRTVRRWETDEDLPIHRHRHNQQKSIYAYKSEIDAWLDARSLNSDRRITSKVAMLAVLPFENLSGDPDQEYFSDGLTEEIISQLGKIQRNHLGVIARTSVMTYKGTTRTIRDVGGELTVQYVLEGSVRSSDSRVRISAQLIRVSDETHIWAENYEQTRYDILRFQRDLALSVAAEVCNTLDVPQVARSESPQKESNPIDPQIYETYLKARYLLYRMTPDSLVKSIGFFEQVIVEAPFFAAASAGLAEALQLATNIGGAPPKTTMPQSLDAASRAVAMDPDSAEAYAALGLVHTGHTWNWGAADSAFLRAINLNPSLAIAYQWYAEFLAVMKRFDEAHEMIERARKLDPLSLAVATSHGHVLWLERRPDDLIASMVQVVEMEPHYPLAHILLGWAYAGAGDLVAADTAIACAIEICGPADYFLCLKGYVAARAGRPDEALSLLATVKEMAEKNYVSGFVFAMVYMGLERYDDALDHLDAAFADRTWHMSTIDTFSLFDPIRQHPRFVHLLREMKFSGVS